MSATEITDRTAKNSLKCFIYGLIGIVVAAMLIVTPGTDSGPHGDLFVVQIGGFLLGFAAGCVWLVSILTGLFAVGRERRVLLWVVPEILVIVMFVLYVASLPGAG